jgi:hypothetical protein
MGVGVEGAAWLSDVLLVEWANDLIHLAVLCCKSPFTN